MRAFLAISPDDPTRAAIAAMRDRCRDAVEPVSDRIRASWVRDDALHLTVRFFEDVGESLVEALRQAVEPLADRTDLISIPLTALGGFPRLAAPRVLWIGPPRGWLDTSDGRRLSAIVSGVDAACTALGLPGEDRRWSPHLTLARVKDGERLVGNHIRGLAVSGPALTLEARSLSFYKSELGPSGARHTRLWEANLAD